MSAPAQWNFRDSDGQWVEPPPNGPILAVANPKVWSGGVTYFPRGLCDSARNDGGINPSWLAWCHAPAEPAIPDYSNGFDRWIAQYDLSPDKEDYARLAWDAALASVKT